MLTLTECQFNAVDEGLLRTRYNEVDPLLLAPRHNLMPVSVGTGRNRNIHAASGVERCSPSIARSHEELLYVRRGEKVMGDSVFSPPCAQHEDSEAWRWRRK